MKNNHVYRVYSTQSSKYIKSHSGTKVFLKFGNAQRLADRYNRHTPNLNVYVVHTFTLTEE